jgi:hypothetical protein
LGISPDGGEICADDVRRVITMTKRPIPMSYSAAGFL